MRLGRKSRSLARYAGFGMTRRESLGALAGICCCAPTFVQSMFAQSGKIILPPTVTESDKKARQVVDDAIAALGGDKFLNMEDRIESGRAYSFYNETLSGLTIAKIYTRYMAVAPDRTGEELGVREREAFGKAEDYATIFLEDSAADVTWRGSKALPQDQFDRYKDSTLRGVFYILRMRLHEPGMTFESQGADVVDHLPVDVVDITDSENRVTTGYFHQSTKLPMQQKFTWRDPKTHDPTDEITRYARYRESNGIQWPQEVTRERNGEKIFQLFADSVAFNQGVTDDKFDTSPPVAVKPPKSKRRS